jgi:hypothetical protein
MTGFLFASKYALCCRSTLLPLRPSVTRFLDPPIQCLFILLSSASSFLYQPQSRLALLHVANEKGNCLSRQFK